MKKFDRLFSKLIIGFFLFVTPILLFWWLFYLIKTNIFTGMVIGLLVSLTLNILFLKKITNDFYNIKSELLILLYLIYSIYIFGFFMGVPIFNVMLGILAGIYIARKSALNKIQVVEYKKKLLNYNLFSAIILIFICFSSAYIALNDKYTAANLEGMFNLNFEVTTAMLWMIIIIGRIMLLLIQYFLSVIIANIVYKKGNI